ncbi:MAG: hypothetical protein HY861_02365 [Chlamydiia bacterium]|nr:hypothetical protein [Chlamydiia bacterium]
MQKDAPIASHSNMDRGRLMFCAMFSIVTLLNVGYALLRSVRNTLAVTDLGGGAASIPLYEVCGSMPGAILMTVGLTWLLNRFSIEKVFLIAISCFIGFFLLFVSLVYPSLPLWQEGLAKIHWIPWHQGMAHLLPQFASMLFFTMAELWKIALLTILFWSLANQYLPLDSAKKYYAPLMFGGSLGTFLSGPLIALCTSKTLSSSWGNSLTLMMLSLTIVSGLTVWLFFYLWRTFAGSKKDAKNEKPSLSVWESVRICVKSRYLLLLAWITIADFVAYALGEIIFLDVLKQLYPEPRDYCNYMGKLSQWSSILTAFSALVVTPILLRKCRWVTASLITPICLLVTEGAFFFALWHPTLSQRLDLLVLFGTGLFCLVRAAKYTLFDTNKEISFLLLPPLEKMQGKLVIDGICSRLGKGSSSILSILLIQISGGVLASSGLAGGIALIIAGSCALATSHLGSLVEKKAHALREGV